MKDIVRGSLLFDCYGKLLTVKKQEVMRLYYEEDLSLAEIAEDLGVTRTAVYDSLKKSEKQLEEYENRLGMLAKQEIREKDAAKIRKTLAKIESGIMSGEGISAEVFLKEIEKAKKLADRLSAE